MPIYEYECTLCHKRFERKQRFDEESVSSCPHCQGKARRLLHSIAVIFKGSGFYSTDNRKEPPPPAEEKKSTAESSVKNEKKA